jgi:NAD(P)H-flavin reductase
VLQDETGAKVTKLRLYAPHIHARAGDYAFLCVPAISNLEYHPFSISSDPTRTDGIIDFHIRHLGMGTFTANIENWAAVYQATNLTDKTNAVKIDGPYGQVSLPQWRTGFSAVVFVCGGVGYAMLFV